MPRYNQSSPADWASEQQSRRDDQIRNILNMMMAMKQYRSEDAWKQKEWDYGQSQDAVANTRADQVAQAQIAADQALAQNRLAPDRPPAPTNLQERIRLLQEDPATYSKIYPPAGKSGSKGDDKAKAFDSYFGGIVKKYDDLLKSMPPDFKGTPEYENISAGSSLLAAIQSKRAMGEPLAAEDIVLLNRLNDIAKVRKLGPGVNTPTAPPPLGPGGEQDYWGQYLAGQGQPTAPPEAAPAPMAAPQPPAMQPPPAANIAAVQAAPRPPVLLPVNQPNVDRTVTAQAPTTPPINVIEKTAQRGKVRVKVFSLDGGKTWVDAQGNIIPIGK